MKEKINNFPKEPGIYQFYDENGKLLYIGKAKNLKNRIKSYFLSDVGRGPAIDLMVKEAAEIKYIETESEIEAILLEADLINKLKPRYNTRLRDDKSFLVIRIIKNENPKIEIHALPAGRRNPNQIQESKIQKPNDHYKLFSKIELVRFKNVDFNDKTAWYFGPYPAGLLLKKSLFFLRKIFPFRDCSTTKFNNYRKKGRPCIYGDIRVCTAPCVDWVNQLEYQKNIKYLMSFLKGKKDIVVNDLKKQMKKLSKEKRFEEAALIRNKLYALEHLKDVAVGIRDELFNGNHILFKRIECFDISNIGGLYAVGAMAVFVNGKKSTHDYRKFRIKFFKESNDLLMMEEMLRRRFKNNWPLPDLIVIDGGQTHLKVAKKVIDEFKLDIPIIAIAKGAERKKNEFHYLNESIAKYFLKNIDLQRIVIAARDEAHRFAIAYYRSLHKKGLFK